MLDINKYIIWSIYYLFSPTELALQPGSHLFGWSPSGSYDDYSSESTEKKEGEIY